MDRRHVYILPTGTGYAFAAVLLVLLLWAINYNNSMGFALTFLLFGVALNSMWRTNNNLLDLTVHPAVTEPQFAGRDARFSYRVDNPERVARFGVGLQSRDGAVAYIDIPAGGSVDITISLPARRRGWLRPGRLRLTTRFPLGLFQAWTWVEFDQSCLIYPSPRGGRTLPAEIGVDVGLGAPSAAHGSDDYAGLRSYVPGDSPKHVAWKVAARNGELMVKNFTGHSSPELWLDWYQLDPHGGEDRLAQLCQWVLKADAEGYSYGLRLPNSAITPACGEAHRRHCLEALALCEYQ